ncbi:hypothetical protein ACFV1A_27280 [Streptomyces seoulensis]|uniref:hypothetical protein n=1 Tax=Streptomyces seoulensis TaxID=73044 RepID=UPI0036A5DB89
MEEKTEVIPEMPPVPPVPPVLPATPERTRRRTVIAMIVGAVIVAAVSSGITALLVSGSSRESAGPRPTSAASSPAAPVEDPGDVAAEAQESYNDSPTSKDFELTLKTTEKQCFGSAGCNITVEPHLSYLSVTSLDPEKTLSITYEVRGDESGPVIETMELTDQDQLTYDPVSITTPGRLTKVTAKITDVTVSSLS